MATITSHEEITAALKAQLAVSEINLKNVQAWGDNLQAYMSEGAAALQAEIDDLKASQAKLQHEKELLSSKLISLTSEHAENLSVLIKV